MTELYDVVHIGGSDETPESLGTKEKFWVTYDGVLHLVKFGRENTGEDWAEKIACELCAALYIPHAHYEFVIFDGRRGVLTRTLVEDGGRLILGNELIGGARKDLEVARSYVQKEHTVSRVLAALAVHVRHDIANTWLNFIGYLLLDAWIGNTDRHQENWGIIRAPDDVIRLSPTFDHASSMGRELTDDVRERRLNTKDPRFAVGAFAGRARSALFENPTDKKPLSPIEAFDLSVRALKSSREYWLDRLEAVSDEAVEEIVVRVPPEIMSNVAKKFAIRFLMENRASLLALRDR